MNKIKYLQTDSRWGGLGYPKSPYCLRNCGCGEVAICNCIIEMDRFKKYTPAVIQPYCKQFAAPNGDGTYWSGIPAMMKHYGMTEVMEHATMASLWKELAKGDRVCILLMGSRPGGSKGVHWTSGGHYIAGVAYKKSGSEHMLYIKDSYSNSSLRNGWLGYSTHLRNDVVKVWSGKLAVKKKAHAPTTPYTGKLPTADVKMGSKGENVKRLQTFLNWRFGGYPLTPLAVDGICGECTVSRINRFKRLYEKKYGLKPNGVFGASSRKVAEKVVAAYAPEPLKAWYDAMTTQYNWSKDQAYSWTSPTVESSKTKGTCITFPAVSLQRLGLLPSGYYFYFNPATKRMYEKGGYVSAHPEIYQLMYPKKTASELWKSGQIKKGDICGFDNPGYHTMVFMGMNSSGQPIWNTMGHKRGLGVTYPNYATRKVDMIVRLKKTSK